MHASKLSPNDSWVDVDQWHEFLAQHNVTFTLGARDNATDGEVHEILTKANQVYFFSANRWDWRSNWQEGIDFVLSRNNTERNTNNK